MLENGLAIGAGAVLSALLLVTGTATAAAAAAASGPRTALSSGGQTDPNAAVVNLENGPYGQVLVVGGDGAGYKAATAKKPAHYEYPAGSSLYLATVVHRRTAPRGAGPIARLRNQVVARARVRCRAPARRPIGKRIGPPSRRPVPGRRVGSEQPSVECGVPAGPRHLPGDLCRPSALPLRPGPELLRRRKLLRDRVAPTALAHHVFLVSPQGTPAPGPAALETEAPKKGTTYDTTQLATAMLPGVIPGGAAVSVYAFSADTQWSSNCNGACTVGLHSPDHGGPSVTAAGVNAEAVGTIRRCDGSEQVTYDGHPLYIYSQEQRLVGEGPSQRDRRQRQRGRRLRGHVHARQPLTGRARHRHIEGGSAIGPPPDPPLRWPP